MKSDSEKLKGGCCSKSEAVAVLTLKEDGWIEAEAQVTTTRQRSVVGLQGFVKGFYAGVGEDGNVSAGKEAIIELVYAHLKVK